MKNLIKLTKIKPKTYFCANELSEEWDRKNKIGDEVKSPWKRTRQLWRHRKYFALLNIAFDNWTPGKIDSKYGTPQKNFDRFRKDVAILCGFYTVVVRLDGSTRVEADSISFAKMDEQAFRDLYSKSVDLLIKSVYKKDNMTPERMNELVDQYLSFT